MAEIHESTKALMEQGFWQTRAYQAQGDNEKAVKIETVLLKVFKDTIDDNARLMDILKDTEQKLLALREQ